MGFNTFLKGINPKVKVTARVEFELASFVAAVQHFSLYATWIPLPLIVI